MRSKEPIRELDLDKAFSMCDDLLGRYALLLMCVLQQMTRPMRTYGQRILMRSKEPARKLDLDKASSMHDDMLSCYS